MVRLLPAACMITAACWQPYSSYTLGTDEGTGRPTVEGTGNFGLGQAGELAELAYADVGAGRLAQLGSDALKQPLAGSVLVAGELGRLLGIDADLGHVGAFGV